MLRALAIAAALGLAAAPARASASGAEDPEGPVKLTEAELDEVVAGVGPPAFVLAAGHGPPFASAASSTDPAVNISIKNVRFVFKIKDSNVNLATVLQLNLLGNAVQTASATAVQTGG